MTDNSTQSSKYTPGPWKAAMIGDYPGPGGKFTVCQDTNDIRTMVCEMPHSAISGHGVREANARLIAAAPEMLEALEAVKRWEEYDPDDAGMLPSPVYDKLCAAVAKAEGR